MLPVGDTVRMLRDERNLSQDQLAQKIGVSRSTVATYESGNRFPSLDSLIALARVFGVTTDYLLGVSARKQVSLDVTGLTPRQIESLDFVIKNYRECNANAHKEPGK